MKFAIVWNGEVLDCEILATGTSYLFVRVFKSNGDSFETTVQANDIYKTHTGASTALEQQLLATIGTAEKKLAEIGRPVPQGISKEQQRISELEDLLTSARCIAQRSGESTAWERFDEKLKSAGIGSVTAKVFKILPSDTEG